MTLQFNDTFYFLTEICFDIVVWIFTETLIWCFKIKIIPITSDCTLPLWMVLSISVLWTPHFNMDDFFKLGSDIMHSAVLIRPLTLIALQWPKELDSSFLTVTFWTGSCPLLQTNLKISSFLLLPWAAVTLNRHLGILKIYIWNHI